MKKNNKKGFILAEAIVVGVFVLSLFTFLFTNIIPLVGQYEALEKYDTISSVYNANLIRMMILEDEKAADILSLGSNPYKVYSKDTLCDSSTMKNVNYCKKLLSDTFLNVDKIYITWFRTAKIKAASNRNEYDFNRATREYIATLDDFKEPSGETYNKYKRIIISFNDGTFSNIEVKIAS